MTELTLLTLLVAGSITAQHHGGTNTLLIYWTAIAALLILDPTRGLIVRVLSATIMRRRTRKALQDASIQGRAHEVKHTQVGFLIRVAIARGHNQDQVATAAPTLKSSLNCRSVEVIPDRNKGRIVTLNITTQDPFSIPKLKWPDQDRDTLDIWDPIRLGLNAHGQEVTLLLANEDQGTRSILIAGMNGSGKSVAAAIILATALRSRTPTRIWAADGTELDSAHLRPHVHKYVGANRAAFVAMLQEIVTAMDARKTDLLAQGKVRVMRGDPVDVLFVDEAPFFLNAHKTDKDQSDLAAAARSLIGDIARRGRKYGFMPIVIAQKPTTDSIPSDLVGQLAYRLVFRVKTRQAVVAALDQNLVKDGWDTSNPHNFTPGQKGIGILDTESDRPTWLKCFLLPPEHAVRTRAGRRAGRAAAQAAVARLPVVTGEPADGRASGTEAAPAAADAQAAAALPAATPSAAVAGAVEAPAPLRGAGSDAATGPSSPRSGSAAGGVAAKPRPIAGREAMEAAIMAALAGADAPVNAATVARLVGVAQTNGTLRRALDALARNGRAVKDADGLWGVPGGGA